MKSTFLSLLTIVLFLIVGSCSPKTRSTSSENPISYKASVSKIIRNNCIGCHSGPMASAGLNLGTYKELVKAIRQNHVTDRMNNAQDPMPPDGMLSENDRKLIEEWVKMGFPQS